MLSAKVFGTNGVFAVGLDEDAQPSWASNTAMNRRKETGSRAFIVVLQDMVRPHFAAYFLG
jgi:hypothetical protein